MDDMSFRRKVVGSIGKVLARVYRGVNPGYAGWIAQSVEHHIFMHCGGSQGMYRNALSVIKIATRRTEAALQVDSHPAALAAQPFKQHHKGHRDRASLLALYNDLVAKIKMCPTAPPTVSTTKRRTRRCSVCQAAWHDKRTCPEQPSGAPTCVICLTAKPSMALKCGHVFCEPCLGTLQNQAQTLTCPQCRAVTSRLGRVFI